MKAPNLYHPMLHQDGSHYQQIQEAEHLGHMGLTSSMIHSGIEEHSASATDPMGHSSTQGD